MNFGTYFARRSAAVLIPHTVASHDWPTVTHFMCARTYTPFVVRTPAVTTVMINSPASATTVSYSIIPCQMHQFSIPSYQTATHTHTHTHQFNGPLSGTTQVSRYQKSKSIWILLKQETVSGSGTNWAICKSAPRSRQITMPVPHHSSFLQAGCPSCCPTNSIKALKASQSTEGNKHIISNSKSENILDCVPGRVNKNNNCCLLTSKNFNLFQFSIPSYQTATHTHTHTSLTALCLGLPRSAGTRKVNQSGFY